MTTSTAIRATAYRAAFAGAAVLALGAVEIHRPTTLCLLRATTGVPCPFCGTTTAGVRLGQGDVLGALAANPLTLLALTLLVLAPVLSGRVRLPSRAGPWLLGGALAVSWLWQLARI